MDTFFALLVVFSAAVFYFMPTMLAYGNNHPNLMPIFILNLLLGWTFIIWVICLVIVFWNQNKES